MENVLCYPTFQCCVRDQISSLHRILIVSVSLYIPFISKGTIYYDLLTDPFYMIIINRDIKYKKINITHTHS